MSNINSQTKKRSDCHKILPITYFQVDNRSKDGRQSRCRDCRHLDYEQNATSILAKVRNLSKEQKEKIKKRKRIYQKENSEDLSLVKQLYFEENTELVTAQETRKHEKDRLKVSCWTEELFKEASLIQNNKCGLCGIDVKETSRKRLCCDHDHKTGGNRLLLCDNCNRGLGLFKDNPEVLRKAAAMIEFYKQHITKDKYIPFRE